MVLYNDRLYQWSETGSHTPLQYDSHWLDEWLTDRYRIPVCLSTIHLLSDSCHAPSGHAAVQERHHQTLLPLHGAGQQEKTRNGKKKSPLSAPSMSCCIMLCAGELIVTIRWCHSIRWWPSSRAAWRASLTSSCAKSRGTSAASSPTTAKNQVRPCRTAYLQVTHTSSVARLGQISRIIWQPWLQRCSQGCQIGQEIRNNLATLHTSLMYS